MDIFEFIIKNNYKFNLRNWFTYLWYPLFSEKNILITNEILNFIYSDNIDHHTCNINYRKFLSHNDIKFCIIFYYDNMSNDYPYIINNTQNTWLSIKIDDFKESIMIMDNIYAKKYYIILERILYDYLKYLNQAKLIII